MCVVRCEELLRFGLVGGEDVDIEEFRRGAAWRGGGVEDGFDSVCAGQGQGVENGGKRELELDKADAGAGNQIRRGVDVSGSYAGVGAGGDADGVFAGVGDDDQRDARGCVGGGEKVVAINVGVLQICAQRRAEGVVADAADECGRDFESGGRDGLVGTFAAGDGSEAVSEDGLTGFGDGWGGGDEVDVGGADNDDVGFGRNCAHD